MMGERRTSTDDERAGSLSGPTIRRQLQKKRMASRARNTVIISALAVAFWLCATWVFTSLVTSSWKANNKLCGATLGIENFGVNADLLCPVVEEGK